MATVYWLGTAPAVAQVNTETPAIVEVADIFKITLSNDAGDSYQISYTAAAATVKDVVEGLKAAADVAKAADYSPWDDVTCTEDDLKMTITADTDGVPFYVVTATVDGGGNDTQTLTDASVTANSGPYDWNTAANWSGAAVPVNDDDVYIENSTVDILYGMDQTAVTLDSLTIQQDYTGLLGTAKNIYLQIQVTYNDDGEGVRIGQYYGSASPNGSQRINLNLGATATEVFIYDSCSVSADANLPPIQLLGTSITVLTVDGGIVGVAVGTPAEVSTVLGVCVSGGQVQFGRGVTNGQWKVTGGTQIIRCAVTTIITLYGGTVTTTDVGAVATVTQYAGTFIGNSKGTITQYNYRGGNVDFTQSVDDRAITDFDIYENAAGTIRFNRAFLTITNEVQTHGSTTMTLSGS